MARRTDIEGYTVRELKAHATALKIVGRSKMSPPELLVAVRAGWITEAIAKEERLLAVAPVNVGTVLIYRCGCKIRATCQPRQQNGGGTRFVTGEYVELCVSCFSHRGGNKPSDLEYANIEATGKRTGTPYRFYLWNMTHA